MADFDPYSDEVCAESINSFQKRLVEADNLMKDKNGKIDYEICWKGNEKGRPDDTQRSQTSIYITSSRETDVGK